MAMDLEKIGQLLTGFGEGFQGRGAQYVQGLKDQEASEEQSEIDRVARKDKLDAERQKAMMMDNRVGLGALKSGNIEGFMKLASNRIQNIQSLGGNPEDTLALTSLVTQGKTDEAMRAMEGIEKAAVTRGILPPVEQGSNFVNPSVVSDTGQYYTKDAEGNIVAQDVGGFAQDTTEAEANELKRKKFELEQEKFEADKERQNVTDVQKDREYELDKQRESRIANKLSAGLEERLMKVQDGAREFEKDAISYDTLADDFEKFQPESGVKRSISSFFEKTFGTQGEDAKYRRKFNNIRLGKVVKNLPKGSSSDYEMETFMGGYPDENANPETVATYLRGAAKAARYEAAWNRFQADHISIKGDGRGINQLWKKEFDVPLLKRSVSLAELYHESIAEGIPIESLMKEFGLEYNDVFAK